MARKYKISILLLIVMLALGTVLEQKLYETGEFALKKNAEDIFQSAVNKYFDDQYQNLNFSLQYRFSKSESQRNNCVITDDNEKVVIDINKNRDNKDIAASFHKKMEHTILATENSIKIDSLSLVWNEKLQDVGIISENAILINIKLPKAAKRLVCGDSTLCIPKYKMADTFYTGLSNEIEIMAFIHYSWMTVIKHSSLNVIIISFFILSSITFLSLIFLFKKILKKPHLHISPAVDSNGVKTLVISNIRYELHQFYVDDKKIHIRPQSASLLLFLLQKSEYYATKSEIIDYLWTAKVDADTRLRRAISDLRSVLKEESINIKIATEENGFRLIIQN